MQLYCCYRTEIILLAAHTHKCYLLNKPVFADLFKGSWKSGDCRVASSITSVICECQSLGVQPFILFCMLNSFPKGIFYLVL